MRKRSAAADLFSIFPAARTTDPDTSHAAAAKVARNGAAASHRAAARKAVNERPGSTSAELALHAGLDRVEMARRLPELEAAGVIRKGPARPCTTNGNAMVTWYPAEAEDRQ